MWGQWQIIKSVVWESATRAVYESHTRGFFMVENRVTGLHSPTLLLQYLVRTHAFVIAFTIVLQNLYFLPLWSHQPIGGGSKKKNLYNEDNYNNNKTHKYIKFYLIN